MAGVKTKKLVEVLAILFTIYDYPQETKSILEGCQLRRISNDLMLFTNMNLLSL